MAQLAREDLAALRNASKNCIVPRSNRRCKVRANMFCTNKKTKTQDWFPPTHTIPKLLLTEMQTIAKADNKTQSKEKQK